MADTASSRAEKLKVFIAYLRADGAALAEELVTGLDLLVSGPFSTVTTSPPPRIGRLG
jgi:hypothetical protein